MEKTIFNLGNPVALNEENGVRCLVFPISKIFIKTIENINANDFFKNYRITGIPETLWIISTFKEFLKEDCEFFLRIKFASNNFTVNFETGKIVEKERIKV